MKKILASIILLLVFYTTNAQNAFLQQVPYRGAFAPAPASPWTTGWANFDPQNTVYPTPNVTVDATIGDTIKVNTTWKSDSTYLIKGLIYVKDGATLTIQPGTVIRGAVATGGNTCIVVTRGSKIVAEGTATRPIVFTSNAAAGSRQRGDWGGIIILGQGKNNISAAITGATGAGVAGVMIVEGLNTSNPLNRHGAGDAGFTLNEDDSSGVLKFVRVEYPGYIFSTDNEVNGITFGSVGRKTVVDYVQVSYSDDDALEWFGGNMNISHAVTLGTRDDDFDTDYGYTGSQQFGLIIRDPGRADASRSNAFESDNEAGGATRAALTFTPKTNPQVSNFTVIGPWQNNKILRPTIPGDYQSITELKRNTEIDIANSVMIGFQVGIGYQDSASVNRFKDSTSRLRHNIIAGTNANRLAALGIAWKAATKGTVYTSYDSIPSDSTKRHFYRSFTTAGAADSDSSFFSIMKNERIDSRYGILVNPVDSVYTRSDFRPYTGSPALSNYDYSTGATDFTISSADRLCTSSLGSVGRILISGSSATAATYSVSAVSGADTLVWYLPSGFSITSRTANSITVRKATGSSGQVSVVPGARCTTNGTFTYGNIAITDASCTGVKPAKPTVSSNYANHSALKGASVTDSVAILTSSRPAGAIRWVWELPTGVIDSASNSTGVVGKDTSAIGVKFLSSFVAGSAVNVKVVNACGDTSLATVLALKSSAPKKAVIKSITGVNNDTTLAVKDPCGYYLNKDALESGVVTYTVDADSLVTSHNWTVTANMEIVGSSTGRSVTVKFLKDFTTGILTNTKISGEGSATATLSIKKQLPAKPSAFNTANLKDAISPFSNVSKFVGTTDSVGYSLKVRALRATEYKWSVDSSRTMSIVRGGAVSDTFANVKFGSGFTSGKLIVYSENTCGVSATASVVIKATAPSFPAATTITGALASSVLCGATNMVLTTSASATDSTRSDYVWGLPTGIVPNASIATTRIDSALGVVRYSTVSNSIAVDWTGTVKSAKITAAGRSNSGIGKAISLSLSSTSASISAISAIKVANVTALNVASPSDSAAFEITIPVVAGAIRYNWRVPAGLTIVAPRTPARVDTATTIKVRKSGNPTDVSVVSVTATNNCGNTSTAMTIAYSAIKGASTGDASLGENATLVAKEDANITSSGSIKLTPNPNKGQFILTVKSTNTVDKASIQIFDAYGRLISTRFVNNSNGIISANINDGNLISGTYNVICTIGSEIKTAQMVVQK